MPCGECDVQEGKNPAGRCAAVDRTEPHRAETLEKNTPKRNLLFVKGSGQKEVYLDRLGLKPGAC